MDAFLKLSNLNGNEIERAVDDLAAISEKYGVEFILSVSEDKENLPANAQECTVIAL